MARPLVAELTVQVGGSEYTGAIALKPRKSHGTILNGRGKKTLPVKVRLVTRELKEGGREERILCNTKVAGGLVFSFKLKDGKTIFHRSANGKNSGGKFSTPIAYLRLINRR